MLSRLWVEHNVSGLSIRMHSLAPRSITLCIHQLSLGVCSKGFSQLTLFHTRLQCAAPCFLVCLLTLTLAERQNGRLTDVPELSRPVSDTGAAVCCPRDPVEDQAAKEPAQPAKHLHSSRHDLHSQDCQYLMKTLQCWGSQDSQRTPKSSLYGFGAIASGE